MNRAVSILIMCAVVMFVYGCGSGEVKSSDNNSDFKEERRAEEDKEKADIVKQKDDAQRISQALIDNNLDAYIGEIVYAEGDVLTKSELDQPYGTLTTFTLAGEDGSRVVASYVGQSEMEEGDTVKVYAEMDRTMEHEESDGSKVETPHLIVGEIEVYVDR